MQRRKFLKYGGAVSASAFSVWAGGRLLAAENWGGGEISHLIPLTSHDTILLKASFAGSRRNPVLRIGSREIPGRPGDTLGRFWSFTASGLESAREYELQLREDGTALAEPWPLRTAPAPDVDAGRFRMLVYTCAGGPDDAVTENGVWRYLPVSTRRRMLRRGLQFNPDLAVGIGDQVYWDQTIARRWNSEAARRSREFIWGKYGSFDEDLPVFGSANETVLAGPISTGTGWPSGARGIEPGVPVDLEVEERVKPLEQNGFTIVDVDPDHIEVRQFTWLPEMGLDAIDNLQPFSTFRLSRNT